MKFSSRADNCARRELHGRGRESRSTFYLLYTSVRNDFRLFLGTREIFSRVSPIFSYYTMPVRDGRAISHPLEIVRDRRGGEVSLLSGIATVDPFREIRSFPRIENPKRRETHAKTLVCERRRVTWPDSLAAVARRSRSYLDNRNFAIQPALHPVPCRRCNALKREKERRERRRSERTPRYGFRVEATSRKIVVAFVTCEMRHETSFLKCLHFAIDIWPVFKIYFNTQSLFLFNK